MSNNTTQPLGLYTYSCFHVENDKQKNKTNSQTNKIKKTYTQTYTGTHSKRHCHQQLLCVVNSIHFEYIDFSFNKKCYQFRYHWPSQMFGKFDKNYFIIRRTFFWSSAAFAFSFQRINLPLVCLTPQTFNTQ